MFKNISSLFVVLILAGQSLGGFVIEVQNGLSFAQNSGNQTIDILASSTAGDAATSMVVDFQISANEFSPTAGVFGQSGMIGFGNIDSGTFNRQGAAPFVNQLATLSIAFTSSQPFPNPVPGILGQFTIDTNSFSTGVYTITPFLGVSNPANTFAFSAGSFTITPSAVPEPATLGLIGLGCVAAAGARRRFGRAKVTA